MAFIDDFPELLNDSVTINAFASRDVHGAPTYTTGVLTYAARVVKKHKLVRDQNGDEALSSFHIWIGSSADTNLETPPSIDVRDQVVLSDGQTPAILAIEEFQDDTSVVSHVKVYFR